MLVFRGVGRYNNISYLHVPLTWLQAPSSPPEVTWTGQAPVGQGQGPVGPAPEAVKVAGVNEVLTLETSCLEDVLSFVGQKQGRGGGVGWVCCKCQFEENMLSCFMDMWRKIASLRVTFFNWGGIMSGLFQKGKCKDTRHCPVLVKGFCWEQMEKHGVWPFDRLGYANRNGVYLGIGGGCNLVT